VTTAARGTETWSGDTGETWASHQPFMDAILADCSRILLAAAEPAPGERVLDIGCGAGASTLAAAEAVGPDGAVLGIDLSPALLARAAERVAQAGLGNVTLTRVDAATHVVEGDRFDLLISRFGMMFFEDPVAALSKIRTALRPGARVVFVAWAGLSHNPWFALQMDAARAVFGPPDAPPDPHAPGPMAFSDIARVVGLLDAAGFTECGGEERAFVLSHPGSPEDLGRLAAQIGPAARRLTDAGGDPEAAARLAQEASARFAVHAVPGAVEVPGTLIVFRATAP
jgi:SAM-dependent methyltransferase